jgi:riboflavin biosynthesis pyrimidine reductase
VRQLLPGPRLENPDLAKLYEYPPGRWLRANMVSSADGAASLKGATAALSSDGDRHVFALLRTLADVIVVGASTARAERYAPVRQHELWHHLREGRPPTPPIAVVSAGLDLDPAGRLIASAPPHARTIVITSAAAPPERRAELAERADVIVAGRQSVDLTAAVSALADRGHRRLLAEGGPHLLGQLVAAGLLDELCLTISPLLAGPAASRIVAGALSPARPLPLTLAHVLEDNGFLLCRYTRKPQLPERTRCVPCHAARIRRPTVPIRHTGKRPADPLWWRGRAPPRSPRWIEALAWPPEGPVTACAGHQGDRDATAHPGRRGQSGR